MISRLKSDSGLMGPTHALSAIAMAFLVTWLASDFMFNTVLGSNSSVVFITAIIIIVGAALMPDLDAVKSTSINVLGPIGTVLSKLMRGSSSMIQSTIRSKSDSPNADPHRGFWHTILSGILVGLLVTGLASINIELFRIKGFSVSVATFIVILIIYISIQLLMASLFKSVYKKSKKSLISMLAVKGGGLIAAIALLALVPNDLNYNWVGAAVTFGWIAHLLGDAMTVSGVPLFFPLKFKGKMWWSHRLPLGIKAGGWIEMSILVPLFSIITIISAIGIIPLLQ